MIETRVEKTGTARRIIGVDVARGLALLGMMAVHTFDTFNAGGGPTPATVIAGGRSAATFVFVAGVSVAFLSGGRTAVRGDRRLAASAGLAVRAVLIGILGLALGYLGADPANVILAFYALMFLLAIPLLGLAPRLLWGIAAALILIGPLLLVATADMSLPYFGSDSDPTLGTLVGDPLGLLVLLFITGAYPVVVYLAYLCAGLGVGRLDLRSRRVAGWLLGGGLALAVTARVVAWVLLYPLGGLAHLASQGGVDGGQVSVIEKLLWEPTQSDSWWYLALPSPHANTPVDLAHTLGSAMAVLGAALLLTRTPVGARLLGPAASAGSMTLTLYTAHLLLLWTGVLGDYTLLQYILLVVGGLTFAVLWQRRFGQGPLERLVAAVSNRARRAVAARTAGREAARLVPTMPADEPERRA